MAFFLLQGYLVRNMNKDLIVLTADKSAEYGLKHLLQRSTALGLRQYTYDTIVHGQHDPGCRKNPEAILRRFISTHKFALVFFDKEGCGQENLDTHKLEEDVEHKLSKNGWNRRNACIIFDPELEIWVWTKSNSTPQILGFDGNYQEMEKWLIKNSFLNNPKRKPVRPKEAFEAILRNSKKPYSSSLFGQIAAQSNLNDCQDAGFLKFKRIMKMWFGATQNYK